MNLISSTRPLNTTMMMNTTMEEEEEEDVTLFSIGPTPMRAHPLYLKVRGQTIDSVCLA